MKFVTVATQDSGFFSIYMQSCKRHGIKPDVLGWGQPWRGFSWRFSLLVDYLESLDPKELVMFTDAYDVIFLRGPEEIEKRYLKLVPNRDKILITADYSYNCILGKYYEWYFGKCKGQRINAGTYMGPANILLDAVKSMKQATNHKTTTDDQAMMTRYCNQNQERYVIDNNRMVFFLCLKEKHCYPGLEKSCVLHGAGNINLTAISKLLGYDNSKLNIRSTYNIQRFASAIQHFRNKYPLAIYTWAVVSLLVTVFIFWQIIVRPNKVGTP